MAPKGRCCLLNFLTRNIGKRGGARIKVEVGKGASTLLGLMRVVGGGFEPNQPCQG